MIEELWAIEVEEFFYDPIWQGLHMNLTPKKRKLLLLSLILKVYSNLEAVFHKAEISAVNEIFFCLKTNKWRVGVKRQKKLS